MNEKLEKIFESTPQTKLGILFGSLGLICALYYFSFYMPEADEMEEVTAAIEGPQGLRAKVFEKEAIARNLDAYEREVEVLDQQLAVALKELPDKREIYLFLDSISDKAKNSGLEVPLFQPQNEQKRDFYAEVPVQIAVRGTFNQVATFFDEVGHLERIVNVDKFSITQPVFENDKVELTTNLTATTFRFLEESERPKPDERDGAAKTRRKKKAE
jgi:type IV pilus assembly protein PilO